MQTNSSRGINILRFIGVFTGLLLAFNVVAQTTDTPVADTAKRPAVATLSPLKKQVSDVAIMLAKQQQYFTLDFEKNNEIRCRVEKSAPEYKLPGSNSRAVLFMLPDYVREYTLKIRSMLHGTGNMHLFSPTVVFLDSLFRPVRLLPNNNFVFGNGKLSQTLSLRAELRMSDSSEKYLLIYTTKSGQKLFTISSAHLNDGVEASPDGKLELEVRRN